MRSLGVFEQRGRKVERITSAQLRRHFPAWNAERYHDGLFDPVLFP
jgi:hypothetical protein